MKSHYFAILALVGITVASPLLEKEGSNFQTRKDNVERAQTNSLNPNSILYKNAVIKTPDNYEVKDNESNIEDDASEDNELKTNTLISKVIRRNIELQREKLGYNYALRKRQGGGGGGRNGGGNGGGNGGNGGGNGGNGGGRGGRGRNGGREGGREGGRDNNDGGREDRQK